MKNKAHTATLNRICQRYNLVPTPDGPYDIQTDQMIIEVETSASIQEAVQRLRDLSEPCYIAVTNKEGLAYAKQQLQGTAVGLLGPKGEVEIAAGDHEFPAMDVASDGTA